MAEVIHGNSGSDQLTAAQNNTQLYGLAGDDTLSSDGKSGVILIGGSGNDVLQMTGGTGTLSGGYGNDTFEINFSAAKKISAVIEDVDPYSDKIIVTFDGDTLPKFSYSISGDDVTWTDDKGYLSLTLKGSDASTDYFEGTAHEYVWDILQLVNQERENVGLNQLILSQDLTDAATIRSREIIDNYSHTRPDGTSCFTAITKSYSSNGENIYSSPTSPEDAMEGWMNSTGHRENILASDFKYLGVGYTYDPDSQWEYHWVQMFGGDLLDATTLSANELLKTDIKAQTTSGSTGNYVYTGGNQTISNYAGEKIFLGTPPAGFYFRGNEFFLGSNSGTLVVQNVANKVIDLRDGSDNPFIKAYLATNPGTIDGRNLAGFEYIVGSSAGSDAIFAGNGGSQLWGSAGNFVDVLTGGAGVDNFLVGKSEGNDAIKNASAVDNVNLYDATLSDLISSAEDNGLIGLAFKTGNVITIQSTETLSAKFNLADGSSYRFNHANKSWQSA